MFYDQYKLQKYVMEVKLGLWKKRTEATCMKCLSTIPRASNITTVDTKWEIRDSW